MADRTIVLAQNKRHAVRGLTVLNPQEFMAYAEDDDDLTYIVDMSSYLDGATISSVTRTPNGVTVSNTSNTTTRLTQRLKGFGYVDINVTSSSGEVEQFRITVKPRANSAFFLSSTGSVPQNTAQLWNVVADVTGSNIDDGISWIRTAGYYSVGDGGGALYKRVYAVPSHSGYITSNAGTYYWELAESSTFNVRQFGAKGDGTTNDTTAINAAFAALRAKVAELDIYAASYFVEFPEGDYLVTSSINATGIRNLVWGIVGPGRIVGQTSGAPIFDLTYARYCTIRDLHVYGSSTNSPNIGILLAVDNSGNVADVHYLDNVSISGYFTTACLYNYGSEDLTAIKLICYNLHSSSSSYCAVFTGHNSLSATSSFKTISANTAVSFNDVAIIHGDFRKSTSGPAILVERAFGLALHDCYGVSLDNAVIVVNKPSSTDSQLLHLDIHCEVGPSMVACVEFRGGSQDIYGFAFKDFAPQASTSIFRNGTGATAVTLRNVDIHIGYFQVTPSANVFSTAGAFTIHGGRVYIGDNTYNNITSLAAFTGIIETDTLGRFVARTSFDVNGTKVVGARDTGWTAMTGSTNKATSYDTATVTTAQLAGRVMAIQAALTTHGLLGA